MERIIWALLFSIFASAAFSVSAADESCTTQLDGHLSALEWTASKPEGISRDTSDWAAAELARINHLRNTIGDCAAANQVSSRYIWLNDVRRSAAFDSKVTRAVSGYIAA